MKPINSPARAMGQPTVTGGRLRPLDYYVIVSCLVLIPSAVFHGLSGLDEKAAFAVFVPILVAGALAGRRSRTQLAQGVPLMVLIVAVGYIATMVAQSNSQLLMSLELAIALIAGYRLFFTLLKPKALRLISLFTTLLLVGGIVGLLYAHFVNRPLMELKVGYRTTYLYLTTFSFATIGSFIRPAGVFDEPGAFAMYVAIITMFNDVLRRNRRLNVAMLTLLPFTGSLAGLSLLALHLVTSLFKRMARGKSVVLVLVLSGAYTVLHSAFPGNALDLALNTFYSQRLEISDGRLEGDNRSSQVDEFFSVVDRDILTRGAKTMADSYQENDQSSNPFSIVYRYGLIISLPYFALLAWLVLITLKNRFQNSYTTLGLFLLLLQRPYIYNMMWSIMIASVVWLVYISSRKPPAYVRNLRPRAGDDPTAAVSGLIG